ncbi:MAG: ATP-binding protein [Verrucomicrobiae bacterium]|nr:ATP-binding protein [Verrucomicrobiae bacterium]
MARFATSTGVFLVFATGCIAAPPSLLSDFSLRRWSVEDGMPEAIVLSVESRRDGYLWCRTPHHRLRFDGLRFMDISEKTPELPPAKPSDAAGAFPEPPAEDGLPPTITAKLQDAEGTWWIGTPSGIYRRQDGRWAGLTMRDGVFPLDVRCLAVDREENLWAGTSGGLVRLRPREVKVFRARLAAGSESVTALLAESPSEFRVGIAGAGFFAGPPDALMPVRAGRLSPRATISALLRSRDRSLWIGTLGDSLWRQTPDGTIRRIPFARRSQNAALGINALLEDRLGRLWVGTWEGLMWLNAKGELTPASDTLAPLPKLANDMVEDLLERRNGEVWAAFQRSGLTRFHPDGRVEHLPKSKNLYEGSPFVLHEDARGDLWIGSSTGLIRLRGRDLAVDRFTTKHGLADDVVLQILEDAEENLWLGTRRGILKVRKRDLDDIAAGLKTQTAVRRLGLEAGMADEECTGRFGARAVQTADGRLWFPTMDGIVMVEPKRIARVAVPAPVRIEEILAGGLVAKPEGGLLRLAHGTRDVEFRFTVPSLTAPDRTYFKTRLEGRDTDWSHATTERAVHYLRLAPGEYRFQAMARDRDSLWSRPSAPLTLRVPPFFWETTGFRAMLGLGALAAAGMGLQFYYRRRAARQVEFIEQRHAVERTRARIARDIHDEVGAGLTEIAMLSELAQAKKDQLAEVQLHLEGIFRRGRELTRSLNEIVWAINPANDSIESFFSYLGEFTQDFLQAAGLACRLDLPIAPPSLLLDAHVRHHLCLATKEALHNAVRHAQAKEVRLSATLEGDRLVVAISDDGRGFEPSAVPDAAGGHDGLTNLRVRMAEIGGSFHQQVEAAKGTRIVLSVRLPAASAPLREPH